MVNQYHIDDSKKDLNLSPSDRQMINDKYEDLLSFNVSEEQLLFKGSRTRLITENMNVGRDYDNLLGSLQGSNFNQTTTFDVSNILGPSFEKNAEKTNSRNGPSTARMKTDINNWKPPRLR